MKLAIYSPLIFLAALFAVAPVSAEDPFEPEMKQMERVPPKSPAEALDTFQLKEGFTVELVAHEPQTTDPVAAAYDENGRLFVAEMLGYPYTDKKYDIAFQDNPGEPYVGRIRLLEDKDDDGFYETSTVFAEGLSWPTGVACWKGGLFVIATPDLWYLKDTTGDGKADVKEKLYTGFRKYNIQAVANNLKWGVDHRIYGAGSGNGGTIVPGDRPNATPVILRRQDFILDPVDRAFSSTSGGARFGNTFSDWYERFICNLRNPAQHVVFESRYLARNPHLVVPSALNDVAMHGDAVKVFRTSPVEVWRDIRARRWVAESYAQPGSELVGAGFVTSASGITVYRGDAYPKTFHDNLFIAEVAGNLVLRQQLTRDGVTFTSERVHQDEEFLTSTDIWFRPVNFVNAPDGTLHMLDMYREVIEHPWSIPEDIKDHLDLLSGRDRGRIYRIVPPDFQRRPAPKLGDASTKELVGLLESPNAWHRETAQRLLFERQDADAPAMLKSLVKTAKTPQARLHALWSLHGHDALDDALLHDALSDASPRVREQAVRLAEGRLAHSETLLDAVKTLAADDDARVRFQVALSLGEAGTDSIVDALARIARIDGDDPWIRTAVLSSTSNIGGPLFSALIDDPAAQDKPGSQAALRDLSRTIGSTGNEGETAKTLRTILDDQALSSPDEEVLRRELLLELAEGLRRGRGSLQNAAKQAGEETAGAIDAVLSAAAEEVSDESLSLDRRNAAVRMLAHAEFEQAKQPLLSVLHPHQPQQLQMAAVRSLGSFREAEVAEALLNGWPAYTPAIRSETVETMLARTDRVLALLEAVREGKIGAGDIDPTRRSLLMRHRDAKIKEAAEAVFATEVAGDRKEVIAAYKPALELKASAAAGEKVFKRECATCHRPGAGQGSAVGPNLATVAHRAADDLLQHILDPNLEVAPDYLSYVAELDDGRIVTGVIAEETATSITLQRAEDQKETILRRNIERIVSTGKSLMPEELEKKISQQEMADLIEFLKTP